MKKDFIVTLLFIVLVTAILYLIVRNFIPNEGFIDTIQDLLQDRVNPLAASQHPLTNPAAPIGIAESSGDSLRKLTIAGLNVPMQIPVLGTSGIFNVQNDLNPSSPRIDNDQSMLGLVKFCKDHAETNKDSPFGDPKFKENCGMCMTSGSLITGEKFDKPTGVLVYKADKDRFYQRKKENGYRFARAIPSVRAAICMGASIDDDSIVPVLPIDTETYDDINRRNKCRTEKAYGNGCGSCVTDYNSWSYVKNPPNGGISDINLISYGLGNIVINVGDASFPVALSSTGSPVNLSSLARSSSTNVPFVEGSTFTINLTSPTSGSLPYYYGLLQGKSPNGKPFNVKIIEAINNVIGSSGKPSDIPRTPTTTYFSDIQITLEQIVPFAGDTSLMIQCSIPVTFVDPDQIASYDCMTGPFVTTENDASMLTEDPCMKPSNQGPDNYTQACINSKIFAAGCSTDGDWYKNGLPASSTVGKTIGDIASWLSAMIGNANTDPVVAKGCYGLDITTPCDSFRDGKSIPDRECMKYLYTNGDGKSYPTASTRFTSLHNKTIQFCQPAGSLNPSSDQGYNDLQTAAAGYSGYKGIDAVKAYLTDVFTKATGNLSLDKEDTSGGRLTSWKKCFGISIDPIPQGPLPSASASPSVPHTGNHIKCTPASGNPVYQSVEVGTRTGSPWYGWGGWEKGAPTPGNGVYWIWYTPNANISAPVHLYNAFEYVFCNTQDVKQAIVYGSIDNAGSVYINDALIVKKSNYSNTFNSTSINLLSGKNTIRVEATNNEGPSGFWMVMKDSKTGKILCKTDSSWVWTNTLPNVPVHPPPEPAPVPKPTPTPTPPVGPATGATFLSRLSTAQFNQLWDAINVNCENSGVCRDCNGYFKTRPNIKNALNTNDINVFYNNIVAVTANGFCSRLGNTVGRSARDTLKSILHI